MSKPNSIESHPEGKMAIRINLGRSGCFRAVLKQCGLILTQCGPEGRVILNQCGPGMSDVFGPGDLCSRAATPRNRTSQPDALHLAQRNLVLCPIVKFGCSRRLMAGHLLGVLEPSVVL